MQSRNIDRFNSLLVCSILMTWPAAANAGIDAAINDWFRPIASAMPAFAAAVASHSAPSSCEARLMRLELDVRELLENPCMCLNTIVKLLAQERQYNAIRKTKRGRSPCCPVYCRKLL